MINVYENNDDGDKIKVFLSIKNNEPNSITLGNQAISKKSGIQFYVDDYVAVQLDKVNMSMDGFTPKLELKEGEELIIPEKSEKEKEIERLKKELERLQEDEREEDAE